MRKQLKKRMWRKKEMWKKKRTIIMVLSSYSLDKAKRDLAPSTPSPLLWRTYQNTLFLIFNSPWTDSSNSIRGPPFQKNHDPTIYQYLLLYLAIIILLLQTDQSPLDIRGRQSIPKWTVARILLSDRHIIINLQVTKEGHEQVRSAIASINKRKEN
jgi:hypothetical protein